MKPYFLFGTLVLFSCGTPVVICGDGDVSPGEACDDGNTSDGDGCRADCFGTERCGDFLLDEGEVCDDGNTDDGDGCTRDCSRREICGDNILDAGEECDDGNNVNADGCNADCRNPACQNQIVDPGELCTGFANDSRVDALPFALKLADVNNDGLLDLISSNAGRAVFHTPPVLEGTISVLFGTGNGKFSGRINYQVHREPISFFVQDLTGDNFADIATINKDSDALSVLVNDGDGFFAAEQEYATGAQPSSVASFDRDGDGDLDLVTTDTLDNQISIFLNQGQDFIFSETVPVAGFPRSVSSQDFDGDGLADIAVARLNDQKISVLLQRNNTWEERELSADGFPISLKTADIDADAAQDIVVSYATTQEVGVFFGDNTGDFPQEVRSLVGVNPGEIDLGDANNDSLLDIFTHNKGSNNVSVLVNEGSRVFASEKRIEDLVLFNSFALGDINADGRLDVSMGVNLSSFGRTFFGDGDGTFNTSPSFVVPETPSQLATTDLDGDSLLDVAVLTPQGASLFLNRGENRIEPASTIAATNAIRLVAYEGSSHRLAAITSDGVLSLLDASSQSQDIAIGGTPTQIIAANLIGGVEDDIVVFDSSTNTLRMFAQEGGVLGEQQTPIAVGDLVVDLSVHDVDADGHNDIVVLTGGSVRVYFGDSTGAFLEETELLTTAPVSHSFVAGALYLVGQDTLTVVTQPNPRELLAQDVVLPGNWISIAAADLNAEAGDELILADSTGEIVGFSQEDFSIVQRFSTESPLSIAALDVSGDTLTELLVLEPGNNRFRVFFSNP